MNAMNRKPAQIRFAPLVAASACAVLMTLALDPAHAQTAGVQKPVATPGAKPTHSLPYDEAANPYRDLQAALADARQTGKRVLVVFGANWCPDCRALDREFHAGGKTADLVRTRYVVVKVDVGHFDKNLGFAKLYGEPIKKGIPSIVVVTPKNEVVYQTRAGELADARGMGAGGIDAFFKEMAERPADR